MVKHIAKQRGLIMTGTEQLEMKLHKLSDKIGRLEFELEKLKAIIKDLNVKGL